MKAWINERAEITPGVTRTRSLRMSRSAAFQDMGRLWGMAVNHLISTDMMIIDIFRPIKPFATDLAFFDACERPAK